MANTTRRRVGIVGYGHLGQFLVNNILERDDIELAFVWNRTPTALKDVDPRYILQDLSKFEEKSCDLIVEVAHPDITRQYGPRFLRYCDYMIGSPTALADETVEKQIREAASKHALFVPTGAFWGGEDIRRMADKGTLQALSITMTKHPSSFKLQEPLRSKNAAVTDAPVTLYDGPVRNLCPLAPNNVNTMAAAAMAAHNLGFDKVTGRIVADPGLTDWHIVEVEVWGPGNRADDTAFHCKTVRRNPAAIGNVTGTATYNSVLASMLIALKGKEPGVHLC